MAEQPALRLVDADGVLVGDQECAECSAKNDQIDGLNRELKAWRARYAALARDKDAEAERDPLYPAACALHEIWKRECGHPRSGWTPVMFFDVRPFLKKDGPAMCLRAIAGAQYDPWKVEQRNGHWRRFDEWERIFGSRGKFESFVNRSPRDWKPNPEDMGTIEEAMDATS